MSNQQQQDQQQQQQQAPPGLRQRLYQNIELAKRGYEQLVHAVIRPPRASYPTSLLGPAEFTFLNQRFVRDDIVLETTNTKTTTTTNNNNNNSSAASSEDDDQNEEEEEEMVVPLKLCASLWTRQSEQPPQEEEQSHQTKTFVIYLHGNASARVEVLPQLSFLLASGIFGVVSLDFTGSGHSDGDYVSLGYYERFDLECVLQYLQQRYHDTDLQIVLWGRSMGASTALMHASQKTRDSMQQQQTNNNNNNNNNNQASTILKGLICDSPFASLDQLCQELVEKARAQGTIVPGVVVSVAIAMIARSVHKKANFDIRELTPVQHAPTIDTPALFIVGAQDDFIPPHHSEDICAAYQRGISTNLLMVPGGHNDARPLLVFEAVAQFLQYRLNLSPDMRLTVPDKVAHVLHKSPPWAFHQDPDIFVAHHNKKQTNKMTNTNTSSFDGTSGSHANADAAVADDEFGMTAARQHDIQDKISSLLTVGGGGGGSGGGSKKENDPAPQQTNTSHNNNDNNNDNDNKQSPSMPITTNETYSATTHNNGTNNGNGNDSQPRKMTREEAEAMGISIGTPINL